MKRYTYQNNTFQPDPEGEWVKADDALAVEKSRDSLANFAADIYERAANVEGDGSSRNWTGLLMDALAAPVVLTRRDKGAHLRSTDSDALIAHTSRLRQLGWRAQRQLATNGQEDLAHELAEALAEMPSLSQAHLAEQIVDALLAEVWQDDLYHNAEELKSALLSAVRRRRLMAGQGHP